KVLEIGTGSGILPIALAKGLSNPSILTLDISEDALETAKINFNENAISDLIEVMCTDFLSWKSDRMFDVIISNPPYIPFSEISGLEPEVKNFEPEFALSDGKDGLTFYRAIAEFCKSGLNPRGWVFLELHADLSDKTREFFQPVLSEIEIITDMQGKPRILKGRK
ncbi:MAG: peptide chain release factor N(5)-glutamine methyltransferase, partial [Bacteroidetes bacterium]|nr:peptide chain release factor N(5)-glutamine methyltransferase [Bacteroidota bacterium]